MYRKRTIVKQTKIIVKEQKREKKEEGIVKERIHSV